MKIKFPENYRPKCFDCNSHGLQKVWLLTGRKGVSGPLGIIGVLCPGCKEIASAISKEGHNPGWDRLAETASQYGFTLMGMVGCWEQVKPGGKWKKKIIKPHEARKTYETPRRNL